MRRAHTTHAVPDSLRHRVDTPETSRPAYPAVPVNRAVQGRGASLAADESLVELRCSVLVCRDGRVLLIRRTEVPEPDWVLPGGRPRVGESLGSCVRREAFEETGLRVQPHRIGLVGEVAGRGRERIVEVVFVGLLDSHDAAPTAAEPGARPTWVRIADLPRLNLRPPIAGYLPALTEGRAHTAAYVGNLWRPAPSESHGPAGGSADVGDGFDDGSRAWPT
jgi:8-oxo-dGTP diphosphatase